jgi:hypothetical protein
VTVISPSAAAAADVRTAAASASDRAVDFMSIPYD